MAGLQGDFSAGQNKQPAAHEDTLYKTLLALHDQTYSLHGHGVFGLARELAESPVLAPLNIKEPLQQVLNFLETPQPRAKSVFDDLTTIFKVDDVGLMQTHAKRLHTESRDPANEELRKIINTLDTLKEDLSVLNDTPHAHDEKITPEALRFEPDTKEAIEQHTKEKDERAAVQAESLSVFKAALVNSLVSPGSEWSHQLKHTIHTISTKFEGGDDIAKLASRLLLDLSDVGELAKNGYAKSVADAVRITVASRHRPEATAPAATL